MAVFHADLVQPGFLRSCPELIGFQIGKGIAMKSWADRQKARGIKLQLSPHPARNCWKKWRDGKHYYLIHPITKEGYDSALLEWSQVIARIDASRPNAKVYHQHRAKQRKKRLGKIRHKLSLLNSVPERDVELWCSVAQLVHELVDDGMPPSNVELRELLLPVIRELPDLEETPRGFDLVLREIDRFLAIQPPVQASKRSIVPDPKVERVAELLQGRSIVIIGGDRRPDAYAALKEAFRLTNLEWIETRPHQSIADFEPYVACPDVSLVLLAIRWTSHSHGDVKAFCDNHGKPFVRLPGGYNPRQVAAQILSQCSDRLSTD